MIKDVKFIMIAILVLCISAISIAQNMGIPFQIRSGNENIDCSPPYAAPLCFDYDGDGLKDLIVGTYKGVFRFYKNVGAQANPTYNGFELIQVNGEDAKVPNW